MRLILPFLKIFHDATLHISGSAYVTSNMYMFDAFEIGSKIKQMSTSRDLSVSVRLMANKTKKKYDKHWGSIICLNILLNDLSCVASEIQIKIHELDDC